LTSARGVNVASETHDVRANGSSNGAAIQPQDVLPFPPPPPPPPTASRAGRTMQESSYENRVQPRRLPEDAPSVLIVSLDYWDRAPFPFTGTIENVNVRYTS
jgi:hypothetical protein